MAGEMILVDTSILIDYYRKTDKSNAAWIRLIRDGYEFSVSAITKYEIYAGASAGQLSFWDTVFKSITIIPFDGICVDVAVKINANLKRKRKKIDLADLFIAATAVAHQLTFSTLNRKHFDRIEELRVL
ncbi:type II toxin-antitoxin system VapC family toxin [Niabella ginsengisoli]|uniref:Ribonuclease VapC n=1 Tax=Niabella ginsengisoli TaxID=522298 RepID=A0ABS9SMT9_9BACT|nr:type II toxin-antitoxin system VapC family toxin [Niabella ginsengisoli]MCH5599708.1 type II toxin-antitoxin system VapC family toxin [Niabella ginsengisoli]